VEFEPAELPRFLRPLLRDLDETDAFALDARLRRAIRLEQRLDAEIAPLLRHVSHADFAWRRRHHTLAAFAREHLGMSPRKARALLRLERVGDVCPELRAAYRDGRISWLQAQILAPLLVIQAEGDWRRAWVAWASQITVRRLDEGVDHALWLRESDPRSWERGLADPEAMDASLASRDPGGDSSESGVAGKGGDSDRESEQAERQVCARPIDRVGPIRIRIWAPRDVARLFRAVLSRVRLALERETGRLASEAEAFEVMIDHADATWGVDERWFKRQLRAKWAVFERDEWRCTVPGCSSRRNLHAHHIVFRSAGGSDALENQTTLCAFHHQRGVHGGTVRVAGQAPDRLTFELGTRTGRPPLARYRSGDYILPIETLSP
jgi:hypothetical protein